MDGGHAEQIAALEQWNLALDRPRRRTPVECPEVLTRAYQRLIVAVGFGRLGAPERARSEAAAAFAALAPYQGDPVHAVAVEAFGARLEDACAGRSRLVPLPAPVSARRAAHSPPVAYKVGRLWETCRTLEPGFRREDAIGNFGRRERAVSPSPLLERDLTATVLAAWLTEELAAARTLDPATTARITEGLERSVELSEHVGMPLVAEAVAMLETMSEPPLALRIAVLHVIARYGWGELVPPLLEPLILQLERLPEVELVDPLDHTLRALRRLGLVDELGRVLAAFGERRAELPRRCEVELVAPFAIHYLLAGARAFVEQRPLLVPAPGALDRQVGLMWLRCVANGHALTAVPHALGGLERLQDGYTGTTDAHATNTHFCVSVLDFTDALVEGIVLSRMGRGMP